MIQKCNAVEDDKRFLEKELSTLKNLDKQKRMLNEKIVDLEEEVKKITDLNNAYLVQKRVSEDELTKARNEKEKLLKEVQEKDKKIKELQRKMANLEEEVVVSRKQVESTEQ